MSAHARQTDPIESHQAAASVKDLTGNQTAVLHILRMMGAPATDQELVEYYGIMWKSLSLPETGGGTGPEPMVVFGLVIVMVGFALWRGLRRA